MSSTEITTTNTPMSINTPSSGVETMLAHKGLEKLRAHAEMKAMAMDYAKFITQTGACPQPFVGKPLDAAAAIMRGVSLGFDPEGALEAFFVIHGKTGMYARAMIAVAERIGCKVWEDEDSNDESVTWHGMKPGDDQVQSVTWDIARAEKAGYTSNKKYQTNPKEMLRAKCQTELARIIAPGAMMGLVSEVEKEEVQRTPVLRARAERVSKGVKPSLEEAVSKPQKTGGLEQALVAVEKAMSVEALEGIYAHAETLGFSEEDLQDLASACADKKAELEGEAQ